MKYKINNIFLFKNKNEIKNLNKIKNTKAYITKF
jgi:hypothetical protein